MPYYLMVCKEGVKVNLNCFLSALSNYIYRFIEKNWIQVFMSLQLLVAIGHETL